MEIVLGSYPQPVRSLSAELVGQNVMALVVTCNTATAAAIDWLRTEYPNLPIIGVEPAVKPAVALSKTGRIGVMATRSTLTSARFQALLAARAGNPATAWQAPSNPVPALQTLQK